MSPIRSPIRSAISSAIRSAFSAGSGGPANSATAWYFGANGLAGTPWNDLSRTGLGTRIGPTGLVEYGPHNLAAPSSDFSSANYSKILGVTVSGSPGSQTINFPGVANAERIDFSSGIAASSSSLWSATFRLRGSGQIRIALAGSTGGEIETLITLTGLDTDYTVSGNAAAVATGNIVARLIRRSSEAAPTGVVWSRLQFNFGGVAEYLENTTTAARYLPRITHDPVTLASQGLLIEGAGTNGSPKAEDFADASAWPPAASTNVSSNVGVAPDGTTTADLIYPATTGSGRRLNGGPPGIGSGINTVSLYAKYSGIPWIYVFAGDGSGPGAWFNVQTGAVSNVKAGYTASTQQMPNGWYRLVMTTSSMTSVYLRYFGVSSTAGSESVTANGTDGALIWGYQVEAGSVATSYIPNVGAGTAVRVADWTGPGVALTGAALAAAFPSGVTGPFTGVFKYRKSYSTATDETLLALSAGATFGTTNGFAVQTNGTQAKLTTSAGDGTATGTLVHDGSTVNRIAYSVDPVAGKMSLSVNGAAAVETTGIAYTGAGVTSLIPGSQTTGGLEPVTQMEISEWDNKRTTYVTGAALQALSA
jgi:hypothetical protein